MNLNGAFQYCSVQILVLLSASFFEACVLCDVVLASNDNPITSIVHVVYGVIMDVTCNYRIAILFEIQISFVVIPDYP